MKLRNRIVGLENIKAADLAPHPKNWRSHPREQRDALRGVLAEIGIADALLVRKANGGYQILDGHCRAEETPDTEWPCLVVDLTDAEAEKLLATHDPLAAMAEADADALKELLAGVETENEAVARMLEAIAGEAEAVIADDDEPQCEPYQPLFSDEQIVEEAFRYFRRTGFPYPTITLHEAMQELNALSRTPPDAQLRSIAGMCVANAYHSHRLHATVSGMRSPYEAFSDDKALRKAIALHMTFAKKVGTGYMGELNIVNGTQACANFRPAYAMRLYRKYCPQGGTVLDTSTGYGGRLVGAIAAQNVGKYVGIDPNEDTYACNARMAEDMGWAGSVMLLNLPAEDVDPASIPPCDFAFTSPPYFAKEHYSHDDTQSWVRYKTGDAWRDGFLARMFALQFAVLKPGAMSVVNIADVKIGKETFPLVRWAAECAEAVGFDRERDEAPYQFAEFVGAHGEDITNVEREEAVLVFRKPAVA